MMSLSCVLLGAGNLATHLGKELKHHGIEILQVYSRTQDSAKKLAVDLNTNFTINPGEIINSGDIYIVALKDEAINNVLPRVDFKNKLIIHCSGSVALTELDKYSSNTGVLYPLQTFSKTRQIEFSEIPIFIEANSVKNLAVIRSVANKISKNVIEVDSEKRKHIHLAAVFACNFVNHLYAISKSILDEKELDFNILRPLIEETAMKVQDLLPHEAQTGPALRFDKNIIEEHLKLLKGKPEMEKLYQLVSESIFNKHQKNK